jgi:adenine phosphoribosyltransferase
MDPIEIDTLKSGIRDVVDFPKQGIIFKDITPVLASPKLFSIALDALLETAADQKIDKVVGIDARGFIFGAAIADRIKAGFVPMRKKGKLPFKTQEASYKLEYGEATIELHEDAIDPGENIFLVDDLLATGGTAAAAVKLIQALEGNLTAASFLIELEILGGRQHLTDATTVHSILQY